MHHAQPSLGSGQGLAEEACYTHSSPVMRGKDLMSVPRGKGLYYWLTLFVPHDASRRKNLYFNWDVQGRRFNSIDSPQSQCWQPSKFDNLCKWNETLSGAFLTLWPQSSTHLFPMRHTTKRESWVASERTAETSSSACSFSRWIFRSPDAASVYGRRQG